MTKGDRLLAFAACSLVMCSAALTFVTVRLLVAGHRPPEPLNVVTDWRAFAAHGTRIGAESTSVTLLEFVDYQCGPCKALAPALAEIIKQNPLSVSLVVRQFPFEGPTSVLAAKTAVCVAALGGSFGKYHAMLMRARFIARDSLVQYARLSGMADTAGLNRCVRGTTASAILASDRRAADSLGVFGTPTTFVNGKEYAGAQTGFGAIVDAEILRVSEQRMRDLADRGLRTRDAAPHTP